MGHFSRGQLHHSSGWRKGAKCIGFPKVTASSVPTFADCCGRITCMGCEPSRDHIDWGPLKGSPGRAAVGEGCLRRGSHRWKSITKPLGRHTGGHLDQWSPQLYWHFSELTKMSKFIHFISDCNVYRGKGKMQSNFDKFNSRCKHTKLSQPLSRKGTLFHRPGPYSL